MNVGIRASVAIVAAAFAVALAGCRSEESPSRAAAPPPVVGVAAPVERTVAEWDEHTGRLAAVNTVKVRPRVSGYVERVHFDEGSMVRAGDLLFTLDPRTFRADLKEVEADAAEARARLELAQSENARVADLAGSRAVSQEEVDRRQREVESAAAALASAEAEVAAAALDLEFTRVTAPISGRVSRIEVTEGNLVSGGSDTATVLTSIVSLDPIYLYFTPDEKTALSYLRRQRSADADGIPVEMEIAGESGFPHQGRLDFVDNRIDEKTGTLLVRAVFDNPEGTLLPGLFARVRLQARPPAPALLVPEEAVVLDQTWEVVLVVGPGNVVERRRVTTGATLDGMTVIREGLGRDDSVIVEGIQQARPDTEVTPDPVTRAEAEPEAPDGAGEGAAQ